MELKNEISAFKDFLLSNDLSPSQRLLWYTLHAINLSCSKNGTFNAPNQTLELLSGLSRSGILQCRNQLKQAGLIDFKTNGTKATTYILRSLYCSNSYAESEQDCKQDCKQDCEQDCKQDCKQDCITYIDRQTDMTERACAREDGAAIAAEHFEQRTGLTVNADRFGELDHFIAVGVSPGLIMRLIDYAVDHRKKNVWNYVMAAVNGNIKKGIFTEEQHENAEKANTGENNNGQTCMENASAYEYFSERREVDAYHG